MTAKEMFEELGYIESFYVTLSGDIRYINNIKQIDIIFRSENQVYFVNSSHGRGISKETHLAIHQQMKDLGWIK